MGWIKFDDAYQCDLSEIVAYRRKNVWPIRCPDCKEWIGEPVREVELHMGWEAYRGNYPVSYHDPKFDDVFGSVTHYFKECECGAQLTVFTK